MIDRNNPTMKRLLALLLACALLPVLALPVCAGADPAKADEMDFTEENFALPTIPDDCTGGKPWMDPCIPGNVTADTKTSPQMIFISMPTGTGSSQTISGRLAGHAGRPGGRGQSAGTGGPGG